MIMFLDRVSKFLSYWYLQYILVTSLYMLEPIERRIFNFLLVALVAMGLYTSCQFLPGHAVMMMHFIECNILGKESTGE